MLTIAAAAEASRGWGGPVALGLAIAAFAIVAGVTETLRTRLENPSPTEGDAPGVSVKQQVAAVSDTDDTDADTGGWWGRVATIGGRRVRVYDDVDEDQGDEHDDEHDDDRDEDEPTNMSMVIARMDDQGIAYSRIVDHLMDRYRVSESTAKRRIREVRKIRELA
ncbi:hypothetical protein [Micromonospora carbonacea]|uniref:Uncharacterized protein n=1 Tax=Micromonospora carbonacea TaxID=47853 RepID=A0A1C4X087_9ACTN|nr:hypothetical protein [Micromonospora carbonacea]SCF01907.1 hypothetical protein GA0070563_104145 [Micromonospora carbonacea]